MHLAVVCVEDFVPVQCRIAVEMTKEEDWISPSKPQRLTQQLFVGRDKGEVIYSS